MKIDSHDQIVKSLFPDKTTKARPDGEDGFGRILKETIAGTQRPDTKPRQTTFANPLASIRLTTPGAPVPRSAVDRIENMIDLLDRYRHKLADPQMNLKQLDPIINEIARENDNLAVLADSLPENDDLKNILDRTMVTASLEVTKFYRGDYLPA
jgi:hypothetical protein